MFPLLFNVVLDFALKKVEHAINARELSAEGRLRDFACADDFCLFAGYLKDTRRTIKTIVCEAIIMG